MTIKIVVLYLVNLKKKKISNTFELIIFTASWTYDASKINLLNNSDKGDMSNFLSNGEWELIDVIAERNEKIYSCCPDNPYPDVTYYIIIRRKPLYYIFNMILPCMVLTLVALLGFLVPPESGEVD